TILLGLARSPGAADILLDLTLAHAELLKALGATLLELLDAGDIGAAAIDVVAQDEQELRVVVLLLETAVVAVDRAHGLEVQLRIERRVLLTDFSLGALHVML